MTAIRAGQAAAWILFEEDFAGNYIQISQTQDHTHANQDLIYCALTFDPKKRKHDRSFNPRRNPNLREQTNALQHGDWERFREVSSRLNITIVR